MYEDPLCENALTQIDDWLETCRLGHGESCDVAREKMELPTRVIDLSAMPTREMMLAKSSWSELFLDSKCRLVENNIPKLGYYTALSYCWGLSRAYMTTKSTLEGRLGGFDFALLPKSLQDGIMLTRFLGLQYIWIDCLCIVQDDEDDWHREAGRMGDVYSKSYLTIAAARSADSNNGFLAPRETKMTDLVSLEDAEGPFQLGFRVYDVSAAPGSFETAIMEPLQVIIVPFTFLPSYLTTQQTEPLTTRAWTLQERLLAPRSLHFGKQQTYWECPQTFLSENGDTFGVADEDYRLDYIVQGLQAESELRWRWYKLLEAYTSRSMTKHTDKLPALSGIAGAIQRQTKDAYYAGIWGKNFLVDLLWRLEDLRNMRKPDAWRAPSWSWASVDGVIRHEEIAYATQPWAELEFCSVTPIGENPLGGVQDGFAQIRAPLTRVVNVALERSEGGFKCDIEVQGECFKKAKLFLDFERRNECLVLMVTPISGLAVEKVDGAGETYVRVGVVQILKTYNEASLEVSLYPVAKSIRLL